MILAHTAKYYLINSDINVFLPILVFSCCILQLDFKLALTSYPQVVFVHTQKN
jgi:hypothetical protein